MHSVFISYHHSNDQAWKDDLDRFAEKHRVFENHSVSLGDIPQNLQDERVHQFIKDEYLSNSTVTIVLVGKETKYRKHVDWEIYSSMLKNESNDQSGILVINLPTIDTGLDWLPTDSDDAIAPFFGQQTVETLSTREKFKRAFPYMPIRIIDSLGGGVPISVIGWERLSKDRLSSLIDLTYSRRANCKYDMSRPLLNVKGSLMQTRRPSFAATFMSDIMPHGTPRRLNRIRFTRNERSTSGLQIKKA